MQLSTGRVLAPWAAIAVLHAGCGGAVRFDESEASDGDGEGAVTSVGTGAGADACEDLCVREGDGWCFEPDECFAHCSANIGGWPAAVREAFQACAATDPLCFISVEGCMLQQLHPPGSIHLVSAGGSGFDGLEGRTVHARLSDPPAPQIATIAGGAFAFEWAEPVPVFDVGGPLVLVWIDVDADGACDGAVDLTAAETTAWNGDLVDPRYAVTLAPPLDAAPFVCNDSP